MDLLTWGLGILLLAFNFFFVLAEFALVRVRGSRVQELIDAGDKRAVIIARIQKKMDEYLSVVQVGITGATLGIGIIIEGGIADPIQHVLIEWLGKSPLVEFTGHALGFFVATYLVIVTSELLPKSVAFRYAEPCALMCARPLLWAHHALFPILWLLTRSAMVLLRLLRLTKGTDEEPHSEDELRIILDQSQEHGLMSFRRLLFMENIFELGELTVKDAMRPRNGVRTLHADLPNEEILQLIRTYPFSRFPLMDDTSAKPIGIIHVKDLLYAVVGHGGYAVPLPTLRSIARPALVVAPNASLETVFADMQRRRQQIAVVVEGDRWVGLVTMEDILEEIVGTIGDEFESEPPITLSDHLTAGRVVLDVDAPTLAAAIRGALARIPAEELPLEAEAIVKAVMDRERLAGTYLGKGIALPHARIPNLPKPALLVIRSRRGIPVEGSTERARLLFVLLTPAGQPRVHQRLQARIAGIIENSEYVEDRLLAATSPQEVVDIIHTGEQASLD